jgi:hypothetical protein
MSQNEYATFGPEDGTGRSWNDYFRAIKGRPDPDAEPADDGDDDDLSGSVTVTIQAHELSDGWPQSINTWRNRLLANSWTVKVGHCKAVWDDQYYKNGNLKKLAHEEEQYWVDAVRGDKYVTISYNYVDGKVQGQRTFRQVKSEWFRKYSDKEMQELIKS